MSLWRLALLIVVGLIGAFAIGGIVLGFFLSTPPYRGPTSDHFDGKRFRNQEATAHGGTFDVLRWMLSREPGPWREPIDAEPGPPPPRSVPRGNLRVTFVNHATTLIQVDGVNILTDPHWGERASPVEWGGPRRHRPPGIRFEDLPRIDVVLLSHNHYDHLNLPTLRRLAREHRPRFIVPLGVARFLARKGITGAEEVDWWQELALRDSVRLTAVPTKHFSGRGFFDRDRTLWASYVIAGPSGTTYFGGDTGFGPHFQQVRDRFGPPRLAILPIGAFRPVWFMSRVHVSPEESLRAHEILGAGTSIAIHFGTFRLADDGQDEPVERLQKALASVAGERPRFFVLGFGEGRDVPTP